MKLLTNTEQLVTKCAILHVDNGSFWTVNLISVGTTHGWQYPRWQHVKATYHTDTAPVSGGDVRKLSANYFFFGFVWFTSIFERLCMRVTLRVCLREWVFIFGIKKASMFFFCFVWWSDKCVPSKAKEANCSCQAARWNTGRSVIEDKLWVWVRMNMQWNLLSSPMDYRMIDGWLVLPAVILMETIHMWDE